MQEEYCNYHSLWLRTLAMLKADESTFRKRSMARPRETLSSKTSDLATRMQESLQPVRYSTPIDIWTSLNMSERDLAQKSSQHNCALAWMWISVHEAVPGSLSLIGQ